jgi:hypothetical protein
MLRLVNGRTAAWFLWARLCVCVSEEEQPAHNNRLCVSVSGLSEPTMPAAPRRKKGESTSSSSKAAELLAQSGSTGFIGFGAFSNTPAAAAVSQTDTPGAATKSAAFSQFYEGPDTDLQVMTAPCDCTVVWSSLTQSYS